MKNAKYFTCSKCKRTLLGIAAIDAKAPISVEGFHNIELCGTCFGQTVLFWKGEGDDLLKFLMKEEEYLRDRHGIDKHADACRAKVEEIEDYIKKHMFMFNGNNITTAFSSQQGLKILDELGLNYHAHCEVPVYDEYYVKHKYEFDAYIELKRKVGIDFDGSIHNREDVKAKDETRDNNLRRKGYIVLRFTMNDIMNKRSYVRSSILDALFARSKTLQGSAEKTSQAISSQKSQKGTTIDRQGVLS